MRFARGSVDVSSVQDQRLLEQVLKSQFITHSQLWEFLRDRCYEFSRGSFCWRVKRLVQHGLLVQRIVPGARGEVVYALSALGAATLQANGETFYADDPRVIGKRAAHPHVLHALTLNDIHLRLLCAGLLEEWLCETEIRSRNEFTGDGFAKDYDAIVTLRCAGKTGTVALEYERTPKSTKEYQRIATALNAEARVQAVIYAVPNVQMESYLLHGLRGSRCRILICQASQFAASPADAALIDVARGSQRRLADCLS